MPRRSASKNNSTPSTPASNRSAKPSSKAPVRFANDETKVDDNDDDFKTPIRTKRVVNDEQHDLISEPLLFPRCEYKARFQGTTIFLMEDVEYYAQYFRAAGSRWGGDESLHHETPDINVLIKEHAARNQYAARTHSGSKSTPLKNPDLLNLLNTSKMCNSFAACHFAPGKIIRDELLTYKLKMSQLVVQKFKEHLGPDFSNLQPMRLFYAHQPDICKKRPIVYVESNYPCVVVRLPIFNVDWAPPNNLPVNSLAMHFQKGNGKDLTASPLQCLCVAVFIANVNALAWNNGIPIEMVHRAGFGFNSPSVAETKETFRINMGIVPDAYANLVAQALSETFKLFILVTTSKDQFWARLAQKVPAPKNVRVKSKHTLLYELLMRCCWRVDVLIDQLWKRQSNNQSAQKVTCSMLQIALQLMVNKIEVSDAGSVEGDKLKELSIAEKKQWPANNINNLVEDTIWYTLIRRLLRSLGCNDHFEGIQGVYAKLEKANLAFVHQHAQSDVETKDGYGSDSDDEFNDDVHGRIYVRKLRVHNGMKAICLAVRVAIHQLDNNKCQTFSICDHFMYFETEEALKTISWTEPIKKVSPKIVHRQLKPKEAKREVSENVLLMFDLNHFNKIGGYSENGSLAECLEKAKPKIVLLDHTSSTSDQLLEAVRSCLKSPGVSLILLVLSGIKHDQGGADYSPYGEMRLIARKNSIVKSLYGQALHFLKPASQSDAATAKKTTKKRSPATSNAVVDPVDVNHVPAITHSLARAYKNLGHAFSVKHLWEHSLHLTEAPVVGATPANTKTTARSLNFLSPADGSSSSKDKNEEAELSNSLSNLTLKSMSCRKK